MNDDWIWFEGVIEPMKWGSKTYSVVFLPASALASLPPNTKRIEGEFGEFPINLALTKAPVAAGAFVYTGKTFLHESGLTIGAPFDARIRPVDPNLVDVPDDILNAIRNSGQTDAWAALTPG
ncbi:hypothetical protein GCM10007385_10820 [Tateyamaria omphalii]|uniref:hypothetical protein n=1 Tax=Tateyamaria omphalii TaxID=299262 RepID=UPI00167BA700|nr:hypothetical protein [Tateyamaria omphalii]GGX44693.1 hypothetical protein GCM10007385_10820 [Tateyamaria omphalii]